MGNYDITLAAGTYHAKALSAGAYETKNGALMIGVQWELDNPEHNTITSRDCIISKAGIVLEKKINNIREWAPGWDGIDTEWFGQHFTEFDVNIVIERRVDQYDQTEKPEVAFINPANGAAHGAIPVADQKAIGAKFGAKLRAFAGSAPKPIKIKKDDPDPNRGSMITKANAEKNTKAWQMFTAAFKGDANDRDAVWGDLVHQAVPNKTNYSDFTDADWDTVIATVENYADGVPF